jgi:sugar phosphate isomerase/epimerase
MKIGLRIPGACGREPIADFARWCADAGFSAMDLGAADEDRTRAVRYAGLEVGTYDLPGTSLLLHPDVAERRKGMETAMAALDRIAGVGGTRAFCVFFPAHDANQSRRDSLAHWTESFPAVAAHAERCGVRIAVEGWPGPNNSALGVTPETLRAMFDAVPTDAFDYRRFLDEFAGRVIHAHGKDTALDADGAYRYGNIGPTLATPVAFGGGDWRYTIPGEGSVDWSFVCGRLAAAGFDGIVSVELEDFRYHGSAEAEKRGLVRAQAHLAQYV